VAGILPTKKKAVFFAVQNMWVSSRRSGAGITRATHVITVKAGIKGGTGDYCYLKFKQLSV
jgi:hypothetical protein